MTKSSPALRTSHNSGEMLAKREPSGAGGDTWSRETIKAIAADIGKDTVAYIEVMYPQAIEATSSTFKLSVRNHIHNQVMAAIELQSAERVEAWLQARKKHRREWLATYRKIRKMDEREPISIAAHIRAIAERVRLRAVSWIPVTGYCKHLTFELEEAQTVEKALLLLAELEDKTIEACPPLSHRVEPSA